VFFSSRTSSHKAQNHRNDSVTTAQLQNGIMPLPKFLEAAVRELALSRPHEDWPSLRQLLIEDGFDGVVVDSCEHEIRRHTKTLIQQSIPRTIPPVPKQGNLPPSPESESSFPRYTTDPPASNLVCQVIALEFCLLTQIFSRKPLFFSSKD
jgi:hypothetical protein